VPNPIDLIFLFTANFGHFFPIWTRPTSAYACTSRGEKEAEAEPIANK
jgi:hypothetical protein